MDQQYGEFIGVDSVYTFPVTTDSAGSYVAGTPEYFAPVAEIAGSPEISTKPTYYDNRVGNNYVTEGKTELKLIVSNVPAEKMAVHLGKNYDAASGRVLDSGVANPPDMGIMFRYNMGKDGYRYYCYLKGNFAGGAESATSKTNDIDAKTYELTYTAVTTTHQWLIDSVLKSLKRVFGDTADSAFDETGWFTQAQTPDTTSAPSAIALSSSVPADGAAAVNKALPLTLTFNNKIASEAISLIKADGTLTAVTKTWDAAGKVLTLTPSSALAGTTTYIMAINGVVDVYGQALADSARDFTTAA
jgi:phi13 family phage major tail protein